MPGDELPLSDAPTARAHATRAAATPADAPWLQALDPRDLPRLARLCAAGRAVLVLRDGRNRLRLVEPRLHAAGIDACDLADLPGGDLALHVPSDTLPGEVGAVLAAARACRPPRAISIERTALTSNALQALVRAVSGSDDEVNPAVAGPGKNFPTGA